MPLAEGVSARIVYKAYNTGVITANSQPDKASAPGASGGQILRRVSSTLALQKDTYQSAEIRSDRQIADFRHGTRRVNGNVSGEFSPLTYADLLEAALGGTWSDTAITGDQTDYTSAAADNATSKFTFVSGDPVDDGFRVGMIVRFAGLSEVGNNGKNFVILSFGGTSNREMTVHPAPTTHGADTSFSITTAGASLFVPSTGFVSRKHAFEIYNEDIDVARLFKECRMGGFNLQLPASGMSQIDFTIMGRDMETLEDSSAPFFSAPAAATSTGIFAAVNGLLRINGVRRGVITGMNIQMDLSPSSDAVVGQNFVPEIFLGRANVTGQVTAFFEDGDLIGNFTDEDEVEILTYLTTSSADDTPAVAVYLPRVKFGAADVQTAGEGGQIMTMPFQAMRYEGAGAGIEDTTIQIVDTEITVVTPS